MSIGRLTSSGAATVPSARRPGRRRPRRRTPGPGLADGGVTETGDAATAVSASSCDASTAQSDTQTAPSPTATLLAKVPIGASEAIAAGGKASALIAGEWRLAGGRESKRPAGAGAGGACRALDGGLLSRG
jgi:hypothetical protein